VGLVLKPSFLPGFSLTVDYYQIAINNAITTVQGFNATTQQACYASGGTSPYCALIQRASGSAVDQTSAVTAYYIKPFNLAQVKSHGVDVEANYVTRLAGKRLAMRVMGNYQPHIYYIQPGSAVVDQGGAGWAPTG
jgi:outer membrane receptor protein involved in Fe transport